MFFLKKIPLSIITLTSLCLTAMLSWAQEQPQPAEPTSVIPYQGTLFSQGKPVSQTDPVKMAFAIYSDSAGLDAGARADAPALNRTWTSWTSVADEDESVVASKTIGVQVRNGRFLVHLGDDARGQELLEDKIFTPDLPADDLYVVTWVVKDSGVVFRLPPQKLGKVPHAVTAERANGFEVMGTLRVDEIEPRTLGASIQVNGGLSVNNDLTVNNGLYRKVMTGQTGLNSLLDIEITTGSGGNSLYTITLFISHCGGGCHYSYRKLIAAFNNYDDIYTLSDQVDKTDDTGSWSINRIPTNSQGQSNQLRLRYDGSTATVTFGAKYLIIIESNNQISN